MSWFLIALLGPFFWALSNHIDKYLLTSWSKHATPGSLILISALFGLVALPIIILIEPEVLSITYINALILLIVGILGGLMTLCYLYALQDEEVSIVMPFHQIIPIFSFILGYFLLDEALSYIQIFASALIIGGAIILSLDITQNKFRLKWKITFLMMISSFLYALAGVLFKFVTVEETFWISSFWEYLGLLLLGLALLCIRSYRKEFTNLLKSSGTFIVGVNTLNEGAVLLGNLAITFATLLAPIALIHVIMGFQSFFVLLIAILLTIFLPKIGIENITKKHLFHKVIAITCMFIGTYLIFV